MDTPCWIWQGGKNQGYGWVDSLRDYAHRLAWRAWTGAFPPKGMTLDHLCRIRACMNPLHLEVVTRRENVLRGNHPSMVAYRTNVCPRGHAFIPENTDHFQRPDGRSRRVCRTCRRAAARVRYARRKEN